MELAELKKELHASIDEVEDEQTLLEIAQLLEKQKDTDYEDTDEFWSAINSARQSIAEGKGISDQDARQQISNIFSKKKINIIWSPEILKDIENLAAYLSEKWPDYVLKNFEVALSRKITLLATNVVVGRPARRYPSVLSILISKHNKLYYEIIDHTLHLLRLWDTRQNPDRNPYK